MQLDIFSNGVYSLRMVWGNKILTEAVAKVGQVRVDEIAEYAQSSGFRINECLKAEMDFLRNKELIIEYESRAAARLAARSDRPENAKIYFVGTIIDFLTAKGFVTGRNVRARAAARLLGISHEAVKRLMRSPRSDTRKIGAVIDV